MLSCDQCSRVFSRRRENLVYMNFHEVELPLIINELNEKDRAGVIKAVIEVISS